MRVQTAYLREEAKPEKSPRSLGKLEPKIQGREECVGGSRTSDTGWECLPTANFSLLLQ